MEDNPGSVVGMPLFLQLSDISCGLILMEMAMEEVARRRRAAEALCQILSRT